jgi:acetaldehyde dehydrogenase/alcohol dehydrogenase
VRSAIKPPATPPVSNMLERARWAARAFAEYDRSTVLEICDAVARAAHREAATYAEWAVRETGFGVVDHKRVKNEYCSAGVMDAYRDADFVTPVVDAARGVIEVPRPAGVVLALTPSTNPVSTVYFKVLLCLMTRNAVIVSPHPLAKESSADAARMMADAAVDAGAPDGVIQWIDNPTIPLIDELMVDPRTAVVLATGGTAVVRSAYRSGNPALGVGPGNVPVLVDATADVASAAKAIADSKAFDNSVLCTNESVLIVERTVDRQLRQQLERNGARILNEQQAQQLRNFAFPDNHLNTAVIGKSAEWIASQAGIRVAPRTNVLVAPFDYVVPEEPLTHEKLSPLLGLTVVDDAAQGIEAARAVIRVAGGGHSAAIHSTDPDTILRFAARVPVLRVSTNVGNSLGGSGWQTNLAPTMTLGTGFAGRSSLGENLEPRHLLNWTRIAYAKDVDRIPDFHGRSPWHAPGSAVPPYPPVPDPSGDQLHGAAPADARHNRRLPATSGHAGLESQSPRTPLGDGAEAEVRAQIRQLVIDELSHLVKESPRG